MSTPSIRPGSMWFVDLDQVCGHEWGKDRPTLVVSSRFHLDLTGHGLASVLPLTGRERPGWLHRVPIADAHGWVIIEQIRTVAAQRFRRAAAYAPPRSPGPPWAGGSIT